MRALSTLVIKFLAVTLLLILTEGAVLAGAYDTKTWKEPVQVSSDKAWASPYVQLAVNEHGDGIAAWQQYNLNSNKYGIWVAWYSKLHGWGKPKRVDKTTDGQVGNPPSVAINEQGDVIVVWPVYNFLSSPLSTAQAHSYLGFCV